MSDTAVPKKAKPAKPTAMKSRLHLLWLILPTAVGTYLLYSLYTYGFSPNDKSNSFALLGSNRIAAFYDLRWILSYSACDGPIRELMQENTYCFGYTNPGYPALSMELGRWLGVGPNDTGWIGFASGAGVMATQAHACWLCTARIKSWSIIVALSWLSFPLQFLIERANLDTIIFLLISLFCLIVWLPGIWSVACANVIAAFSIALKVYPIFGITAWLVYSFKATMPQARKQMLARSLLLTLPASLLLTYLSTNTLLPAGTGAIASHGLKALGYANTFLLDEFGFELGRASIRALFALKAVSLITGSMAGLSLGKALTWPSANRNKPNGPLRYSYIQTLVMVTSAIGLGCYFFSIGYDYRLTFFLPLLAFILANLLDNQSLPLKSKCFFALLMAASAYIFTLPMFAAANTTTNHFLELIDEIMLAPFLFTALSAVWINLFNGLAKEPARAQPFTQPSKGAGANS